MEATAVVVKLMLPKDNVGVRHSEKSLRDITHLPLRCSQCNLCKICLPSRVNDRELVRVNKMVRSRRFVERDQCLYRAGDAFKSLYAVHNGFFKTYAIGQDGGERVTGFQMAGEIIGMDGIGTETYQQHASALEDSEVCVIPYAGFEELLSEIRGLQHQFQQILSREIAHTQDVMTLIGRMRAEERIAAFLLNLSRRLVVRGFSATEFNLRMTRAEIGSYLGMKLETVSRIFSKFQQNGLINVQEKYILIQDAIGLNQVANPHSSLS